MKEAITIDIRGIEIILSPDRVIYIPKLRTLLLSDLHLGRVSHYRKMGYPIPNDLQMANVDRLQKTINYFSPIRLIILGDLFHSDHNSEWENFSALRFHYSKIKFELVKGNHDILGDLAYQKINMKTFDELVLDEFILTHEPLEQPSAKFNICGHIHPAVLLSGRGRQHVKLSCFYFNDYQGVLPPFGALTGKHRIKPRRTDRVFALADGKIFEPEKMS